MPGKRVSSKGAVRRDVGMGMPEIVERAALGFFQSTPAGRYLAANPALARMYGYASPADLMASITDIPRQLYVDEQRRLDLVRLLEAADAVTRFESQVRRKDGSTLWTSLSARAVRGGDGSVLYYEGTVEDVTELKETQDQLRDKAAELEAVFAALPDIYFCTDLEGKICDFRTSQPAALLVPAGGLPPPPGRRGAPSRRGGRVSCRPSRRSRQRVGGREPSTCSPSATWGCATTRPASLLCRLTASWR